LVASGQGEEEKREADEMEDEYDEEE